MEPPQPASPQTKQANPFLIPIAIYSVLVICGLLLTVLLCGVAFLLARRTPNALPLLASPVPTVDMVNEVSADPAWKTYINEEFTSNSRDWPEAPYENDSVRVERKISNGIYSWDFSAKGGWNFYAFPLMKSLRDFVVSADFKHLEGALFDGYGLMFRTSGNSYYYFVISERGHYVLGYERDNNNTTLLEGEKRNLIAPGQFNRILVKAVGERITAYVNNLPVAEVTDKTLYNGEIGLILSPSGMPGGRNNSDTQDTSFSLQQGAYPSRFVVDNFRVWVPSEKFAQSMATPLPPLKPASGRIAFVSKADGNPEIYSITTEGKDLRRLTNNPADDHSPQWSPNGNKIAFVSTRNGSPDLYLMDWDGANMTRLTDDPADDLDPVWSPDGDKLIFTSNRSGKYNLYLLDMDTKSVTRLTEHDWNDRHPSWSPDGKSILFESDQGFFNNFYQLEIETKNLTQFTFDQTNSLRHPIWSPKGLTYLHEQVVGNSKLQLIIRELPNKNPFIVSTVTDLTGMFPAWSPDGSQIAFVANREGTPDIYIISKDGKSIFRLTDNQAAESDLDWTAR